MRSAECGMERIEEEEGGRGRGARERGRNGRTRRRREADSPVVAVWNSRPIMGDVMGDVGAETT
jgi:hypothetical protein